MYVITFYSFKGGVGRTMALVNVAAELVRRGRKVLVVDFDLEAPGLETYRHLRPPKALPGIVEYVTEFRRTQQVPNLLDHIYEAKPIGKKSGRLWVMPAGRRDRAYRSALASLDWTRLYRDGGGFLLFEDMKKGWEEELKPDYVLIDSRSGDTDVLGICTRQLPDAVVLMFTPNEQNLAGLEHVCRDIRREETEGLKKAIRLHFVAANVPDLDDENRILRRQIQAFRDRLDFKDLSGVIRRYENLNLLDQSVVVLDRPRSKLARSYRRLLRMLLKDNMADRDGALAFLHDYSNLYQPSVSQNQEWWHRWNLWWTASRVNSNIEKVTDVFWEDPDILVKVAECRVLEGTFDLALRLLNRAVFINADLAPALLQRALCKDRLGDIPGATTDLIQYLQTQDLHPNDVLRAMREMTAIAPDSLSEAIRFPSVQALDLDQKIEVGKIIASSRAALGIAIDYLRGVLNDHDIADPSIVSLVDLLSHYLIRSRRWQEAIDLLERATEATSLHHICLQLSLDQMMAEWGHTGRLPESFCRWWLDHADNEGNSPYSPPVLNQVNAFALWRLGNTPTALEEIENGIKWMKQRRRDCFSCWRYGMVSPSEFLEDCEEIRRMFQGEPLRPAFLGPPRSPAPA